MRFIKVGGAWAIAALAFGTATIPKVDVIVGPGNLYVTLAKKIVAGTVGIDIIAGPSEVLVMADDSADPEFIAADLLAQAEHDAMASAGAGDHFPGARRGRAGRGGAAAVGAGVAPKSRGESVERFGAIFVVPDVSRAIDLSNRLAPEHLELHLRDPFARLGEIRNAGAVFVGEYTPEPVGDYVAGPNHVLPTAGTARFASALSVDHFLKRTQRHPLFGRGLPPRGRGHRAPGRGRRSGRPREHHPGALRRLPRRGAEPHEPARRSGKQQHRPADPGRDGNGQKEADRIAAGCFNHQRKREVRARCPGN